MVGRALWLMPLLCWLTLGQTAEWPRRRFEYKYSFKGPHLAWRDGSIPFWTKHGNTLPSAEKVRIVPSIRSQSGSVWTKNSVAFENWDVHVAFRIIGRNQIGADGLAIWYTKERGTMGPVYGADDHWHGVGIFFDTFDNDGSKNNPIVLVVQNDGQLTYDHMKDGAGQASGTCLRDYRNIYDPIRVRIRYYQRALKVYLNMGKADVVENYELCTQVIEMDLPLGGYFGVSSATGAVADDHDVLSFITFSLTDPEKTEASTRVHEEQQEDKYQEEYERFEKNLEKRKEEYQKQHPEMRGPDEDAFETESQRELQMVVSGQSLIEGELTRLREKLEEALEEHQQHLKTFSRQSRDRPTGGSGRESGQQDAIDESLMTVLNGQKKAAQQVQEIGTSIDNVLSKVKLSQESLHGMFTDQNHFGEIKEHIHIAKKDIDRLMNTKVQPVSCPKAPPVPSCLSLWHFSAFIVLQSAFFLYYLIHRNRREVNSKKFY
ncbi:protein ERGIC-53-like [Narcine bancroftii]|uniref:protein ERGIC-53-like n=1 Tax=Narcine bancroftii TaxID=1343680 RepID=UPI003831D887